MSKNVFVIGISGYIGGSVFTSLKAAHPEFTYTALVRKESQFPAVKAAGATPILGSFASQDVISRAAYEADVVVNCGSADDLGLTKAIIEGLKKRKAAGKGTGILVHTSGTMIFSDKSNEGKWIEGARPRSDGNVEDIKAIKESDPHGQVDVPILQASLSGDISSYIIAPSAIYGLGTGPVGRITAFVHLFIKAYVEAGRVFVVGEGTNVFGTIHISDLVKFYLLVINHALSFYPSAPATSPYERYYIANTRHVPYSTFAGLFAKALHHRGKLPSAEVASIRPEEAGPYASVFASNSYTKEERGRALGWFPSGPTLEETLEDDILAALQSE